MNKFAILDYASIQPIEAGEQDIPRCILSLRGVSTGKKLNGAVLEAALSWNENFIIFLTDDILFENALHVYLLDADLDVLDSATLCSMYATGIFDSLRLIEPNTVLFRFFGDADWSIEFQPKEVARVPYFFEPAGVTRPFGLYRRFIVRDELPTSGA